jgi:hypothetical protein
MAPSALPAPDHRVDLVDEDDGLAFVLRDFLQHAFSRSSNSPRYLAPASSKAMSSTSTRLFFSDLGHLAVDDALRQAFDDRRLAHARLADQHRVVLGAALQHLDRAADLVVAADHRVELAKAGALGQVERVLLQRLALALGLGAVHLLATAHRLDGTFQRLAGDRPCSAQHAGPMSVLLSARASRNISLAMNWSPRLVASFSAACSRPPARAGLHLLAALHLRQFVH